MTTAVPCRRFSEPLTAVPVHAPGSMATDAARASALDIEDKVDPLATDLEGALDPAARGIVPEQTAVVGREDLEAVGDDPLRAREHERLRAAPVDDEADLPAILRVDEALLVDQQGVPEAVRRHHPGADDERAARADDSNSARRRRLDGVPFAVLDRAAP